MASATLAGREAAISDVGLFTHRVVETAEEVVGVVVARLSAIKMARATGALPQNVNFEISEGSARAFLDSHDVPYETARSGKPMPTADIAANAKALEVGYASLPRDGAAAWPQGAAA